MPQRRVFISIGSNVRPEVNIPRALDLLAAETPIVGLSRFYRTPALGRPNDPDFVNGAVLVTTERSARHLKYDVLRVIEREVGRIRGEDAYAPRPIDLDIVLFGDEVIDEPGLRIPDPDLVVRPFLAIPILEIDPAVHAPDADRPLAAIACEMDQSEMRYDSVVSAMLTDRSCT